MNPKLAIGIVIAIDLLFLGSLIVLLINFDPMWLPTIIGLIIGLVTCPYLKSLFKQVKNRLSTQ